MRILGAGAIKLKNCANYGTYTCTNKGIYTYTMALVPIIHNCPNELNHFFPLLAGAVRVVKVRYVRSSSLDLKVTF
jgi:hypothetical protein